MPLFLLHPSFFTLHPSPFTIHSSKFTLHSSFFTLPSLLLETNPEAKDVDAGARGVGAALGGTQERPEVS